MSRKQHSGCFSGPKIDRYPGECDGDHSDYSVCSVCSVCSV